MAVTRKELKDNAKQSLRGNWGWAIIVFLITAIIVGIFTGAGHWLDETYINYDGTIFSTNLLVQLDQFSFGSVVSLV